MKHIRSTLRRERQEMRALMLTPEDKAKFPEACRLFVLSGKVRFPGDRADLERLKAAPAPQPSVRQMRSARAEGVHAMIRADMAKRKEAPASFKTIKKMAQDFTRRAMKRVQRKSVM